MDKSKRLSIVFVVFSVVLLGWTGFVLAVESGYFVPPQTSWVSDSPALLGVTARNGYYDISLAFSSVNYTRELQNIIINPRDEGSIDGLTGFVNGTAVHGLKPVFSSVIEPGDTLQVHVMFPYARFSPGATVELQVLGGSFGSTGIVKLPDIVTSDALRVIYQ